MEITLQLRYVFARHYDVIVLRHNNVVSLRYNYVIYLFDNVRITLYFDMVELRMEITLQLRLIFAGHCGVFLIRSQLRSSFVCFIYVLLIALELRLFITKK